MQKQDTIDGSARSMPCSSRPYRGQCVHHEGGSPLRLGVLGEGSHRAAFTSAPTALGSSSEDFSSGSAPMSDPEPYAEPKQSGPEAIRRLMERGLEAAEGRKVRA